MPNDVGRFRKYTRVARRESTLTAAGRQRSSEGGASTTSVAILLNMLLLSMIVYGYLQSEELRWAWVLVGVPIVIVTITYVRHWFKH
jgi:hypothetical protein